MTPPTFRRSKFKFQESFKISLVCLRLTCPRELPPMVSGVLRHCISLSGFPAVIPLAAFGKRYFIPNQTVIGTNQRIIDRTSVRTVTSLLETSRLKAVCINIKKSTHMQPEDFQIPQRANNGSALITTPSEKDSFYRQDSDRSGSSSYASSDILYFSRRSPIDRQLPPFDQWREDLSEASMRSQERNQKYIPDSHSGHGGKNPEVSSNHKRAQDEP